MPRQPRLDAPGALHHVMGWGRDRTDFVNRLAALARAGDLVVYAWALLPNYFHLLVRTGQWPLFRSMKRLLTGYVVNFNRWHQRYGHLFQDRYKSIVCDERLLAEAARRDKEALRLARKVVDLAALEGQLRRKAGLAAGELRSGGRRRGVVRARRVFCQLAVRGMGYSGAEVARFLGVTTSSVNRLAVSEELPEARKFLKAL